MSKPRTPNVAASIRDRLLHLARQQGDEFQFTLTRYAAERLLARLARSRHSEQFILKGAMLFELWTGQAHRSTLDVDLLSETSAPIERMVAIFRDIASIPIPDDGLLVDPATVRGEPIREGQRYQGVHIAATATLADARIPVRIDIGFGDVVEPAPLRAAYPTLLATTPPSLRVYPRESVISEKFEAMVSLGLDNTRMKDFFDVLVLSQAFAFDGPPLVRALSATFTRRRTELPTSTPVALSDAFAADPGKARQWTAFVRRGRLRIAAPPLTQVVQDLRTFLWPAAEAARDRRSFARRWSGGRWTG